MRTVTSIIFLATLMAWTGSVVGDEITVKGVVVQGKIVNISAGGVAFEPEMGKGVIVIPFENIDDIQSEHVLLVVHGDHGETLGRVVGFDAGQILVGTDAASAQRVDVTTILETDTGEENEHWYERLRNQYRYWSGSFNLGFSFSDKTTDETDLVLAYRMERKKDPTRLLLTMNYLYGKDKPRGASSSVGDNELRALLKGEIDLNNDRWFSFLSNDFEHDAIEELSLRWVAKAGLGYRFIHTDTTRVQGEIGPSYVYRRFFGGDTDDYGAVALGSEGERKFESGLVGRYSVDYLPSIDDWAENYLIRGEASLEYPITAYIAIRWSIVNAYDNQPQSGTERNETDIYLTLSWKF